MSHKTSIPKKQLPNRVSWRITHNMKKRATRMQDIAQRAGVSVNTVSLALRNSPRISQKTTRKIQRLAEEMNYRRNPMVSALFQQMNSREATRHKATVAILDPNLKLRKKGYLAVVQENVDAAIERFHHQGFAVEEFDGEEWLARPGRFLEILHARGILGIYFLHFPHGHTELDWDLSEFAMATINYSLEKPNLHRANVNQWQAMELGLLKVYEKGYRRPALILTSESDTMSHGQWVSSLYHFQNRFLKPENRIPPLTEWSWKIEERQAIFNHYMKRHRPDVVLSMVGQVRETIEAAGLKIPDDIGFVHLNYGAESRASAAIDIKPAEVGRATADIIIGQIMRNERGVPTTPRITLIPPRWVEGPTLRQQIAAKSK